MTTVIESRESGVAFNSTSTAAAENYTTSPAFQLNSTMTPVTLPFDEIGVIVSATIIFTFLVVGLLGNSLTIAVVATYRSLRENVFMRFILSLCVSDLISALISWLFLYRRTWGFDVWAPLPPVFCRFYWAADIMTSYVTALHILSFAILRYISIQFPVLYNKITIYHGNIWIGLIWAACFFSGFIPFFIIFDARPRDRLSGLPDARWPSCTNIVEDLDKYILYQKIGYVLFLYVPTIGVVSLCILIAATVKVRSRGDKNVNTREKRRKKERQAVLQLLLIAASFLMGYIPFTAYEFFSVQAHPDTRYYRLADYWFGMIEYFFLRFSECLNPIFYNLGSSKMRKHTSSFIKFKLFYCYKWDDSKRKDTTADCGTSETGENGTHNFGV